MTGSSKLCSSSAAKLAYMSSSSQQSTPSGSSMACTDGKTRSISEYANSARTWCRWASDVVRTCGLRRHDDVMSDKVWTTIGHVSQSNGTLTDSYIFLGCLGGLEALSRRRSVRIHSNWPYLGNIRYPVLLTSDSTDRQKLEICADNDDDDDKTRMTIGNMFFWPC